MGVKPTTQVQSFNVGLRCQTLKPARWSNSAKYFAEFDHLASLQPRHNRGVNIKDGSVAFWEF